MFTLIKMLHNLIEKYIIYKLSCYIMNVTTIGIFFLSGQDTYFILHDRKIITIWIFIS